MNQRCCIGYDSLRSWMTSLKERCRLLTKRKLRFWGAQTNTFISHKWHARWITWRHVMLRCGRETRRTRITKSFIEHIWHISSRETSYQRLCSTTRRNGSKLVAGWPGSERLEPRQPDSERLEPEQPDSERLEPGQLDPERPKLERLGPEQPEKPKEHSS